MNENLKKLILREDDPFRPSLENRVAYPFERDISLLTVWMDRERNRNIFRIAADVIRRAGNANVHILDVGCCYGNHLFMLNAMNGKNPSVRLVGVDVNPKTLAFAEAFRDEVPGFSNCHFLRVNADAGLAFRDGTFDLALCSDVLEHFERPADAFREIARTLRPGGRLLVTSPLKSSFFKTLASVLNAMTFGMLTKKYYEGGTKRSAEIRKEDKPEFGFGHISEMSLSGYIRLGRESGLQPVEIIPASVFSGSLFFDRHPFLLAGLMLIEAVHRVFRFKSWAHGVQIVFEKKS